MDLNFIFKNVYNPGCVEEYLCVLRAPLTQQISPVDLGFHFILVCIYLIYPDTIQYHNLIELAIVDEDAENKDCVHES